MSLGVVIKGPEGLVLAADSRITLEARQAGGALIVPVTFDNATKLLSFNKPHNYVAAVTYGLAVIGQRTAHSFIPELEVALDGKERLRVSDYAKLLSDFFVKQWSGSVPRGYKGPGMTFIVAGFDPGDAYGRVFVLEVPGQPSPQPRNPAPNEFGMTWGGQLQIASRLIHGYDPVFMEVVRRTLALEEPKLGELTTAVRTALEFPIPYQVLPLQDCVDLATFLVRSTMTLQGLAIGVRGVGGPIDVATITRTDGLNYIQRKVIRGEDRWTVLQQTP